MLFTARPTLARQAALAGLLVSFTALTACGSDDEPTSPAADAGVLLDIGTSTSADAGTSGTLDGSVAGDGGASTDGGTTGACDPVNGTGCASSDLYCVLDLTMDRGVCRTLPAMKAFGEECSQDLQDCGPGLTCLGFQGDTAPVCHQACVPGGTTCASVPDTTQLYACAVVSQTASYGVCRGSGGAACDPLAATPCATAGEVCTPVAGTLDTACTAAGTTQLGGDCSMSNCAAGQGICMALTSGTSCYQPCAQSTDCTQSGYSCVQVGSETMSYAFGICVPPQAGACNPISNPCPSGQVCSVNATMNGVECVTAGTAPIGGSCDTVNCAPGGFCTPTQNGNICLVPCDPANPTCESGQTCQTFGLDFGVCG